MVRVIAHTVGAMGGHTQQMVFHNALWKIGHDSIQALTPEICMYSTEQIEHMLYYIGIVLLLHTICNISYKWLSIHPRFRMFANSVQKTYEATN